MMTICGALWDIGLTAAGVILGYWVAVGYDRGKTRKAFTEAHNLSMNALVSSLKTNSTYIHQMFTIELPANCYPTYPLDTASLALINFAAWPYLPKNTNWSEKFNRLRFEMEHINRRLLMEFLKGTPIDPNDIQAFYLQYNTNGQIPPLMDAHPWSGISRLLLACKSAIDEQIQELERFGYAGEVVKPY